MVKQEKEKDTPFLFFEYKTDFCGEFLKESLDQTRTCIMCNSGKLSKIFRLQFLHNSKYCVTEIVNLVTKVAHCQVHTSRHSLHCKL